MSGPAPGFLVVGVDGGGSGSRALVMGGDGSERARSEGPPALVHPSNPGAAAGSAGATARDALEKAGATLPVHALWMGLAGAGRPQAREAVEIALRSQGLALRTKVGMDVEGAHYDAFAEGPGILLAVGTGTMMWGRDPDGEAMRVGGWGHPLGEEGSGYWIGLQALRAVVQAADGRGGDTALSGAVLEALELGDAQELVPWMAGATKRDVAMLAPMALQAAEEGDTEAGRIRDQALEALVQHLEVAVREWAPWGGRFPLALSGGLLREGGLMRQPLLERARALGADPYLEPVLAVRGAARLALALLS